MRASCFFCACVYSGLVCRLVHLAMLASIAAVTTNTQVMKSDRDDTNHSLRGRSCVAPKREVGNFQAQVGDIDLKIISFILAFAPTGCWRNWQSRMVSMGAFRGIPRPLESLSGRSDRIRRPRCALCCGRSST